MSMDVSSKSLGRISVIIPMYNAASTIGLCLDAVCKNADLIFEVIVVDDGSSDDSPAIVQAYCLRDKRVKLYVCDHAGPAAARNKGIRVSCGDLLFFIDADVIVMPEILAHLTKQLSDEHIACAGGLTSAASITGVCEEFENNRYEKLYGTKEGYVNFLPTSNLLVRASVVNQIGGFDEGFRFAASEDHDFCARICGAGYKILFCPTVRVMHLHPQKARFVLQRGFRYGKEHTRFLFKHGSTAVGEFYAVMQLVYYLMSSVKRYTMRLFLLGFLYETCFIIGRFCGIILYFFDRNTAPKSA